MKITKETKFDVGQEVFTVWNHLVVPCEVNCELDADWRKNFEVIGNIHEGVKEWQ